jgi:hypothetical protein
MQDFQKALADIDSIRGQVARATQFRGYGPATVALTGVLALLAAGFQAVWLDNPTAQVSAYLAIWVSAATISAVLIGAETITRSQRLHFALADDMIYAAIEQLIPPAVAGILLTVVLVWFAPANVWMLPGLWQILFSLGVFASCRLLPKPLFAAGAWYLASGLVCLVIGAGGAILSPWAMAIPFGVGQLMAAGILYATLGGLDGEE